MTWLKTKRVIHLDETFFTTGIYQDFLTICIGVLIQPYWFLQGRTFRDKFNEFSREIEFQVNDALTVAQIFLKLFPVYVYII